MKEQKHINVTLSIPTDLNALLHAKVSNRGISKYVAEAVRKSLKEDEEKDTLKLEAAYEKASKDQERLKSINEWKSLDDADVEGWDW